MSSTRAISNHRWLLLLFFLGFVAAFGASSVTLLHFLLRLLAATSFVARVMLFLTVKLSPLLVIVELHSRAHIPSTNVVSTVGGDSPFLGFAVAFRPVLRRCSCCPLSSLLQPTGQPVLFPSICCEWWGHIVACEDKDLPLSVKTRIRHYLWEQSGTYEDKDIQLACDCTVFVIASLMWLHLLLLRLWQTSMH